MVEDEIFPNRVGEALAKIIWVESMKSGEQDDMFVARAQVGPFINKLQYIHIFRVLNENCRLFDV